ncbi:hypothetical protein [uncultured Vagococcus sp.]|uniref:hypothetical protein n=1 Tax=uncultured Vagococcus sp. TaxID=189676 RepID=UPI0028D5178F|nr:hypothetical protein [uncultured Vagococcus sp.]
MTQHRKKLELTFKNSQGQVYKSSVTHFLDDLDPVIFSDQLDRTPMLDTVNQQLISQRLRRSQCLKVDRIDTIKNKLFDTK